MKRQSILYITLLSIILLFSVGCEQTEKQNSTKKADSTKMTDKEDAPYFCIVCHKNGKNSGETAFLVYDIESKTLVQALDVTGLCEFPMGVVDVKNDKVYYSLWGDFEKKGTRAGDCLMCYDMKTKKQWQVTEIHHLFDYLTIYNGELYGNIAGRESNGNPQLSRLNPETGKITPIEPDNTDVWYKNISIDYQTGEILASSYSNYASRRYDKNVKKDKYIPWPFFLHSISPDLQTSKVIYTFSDAPYTSLFDNYTEDDKTLSKKWKATANQLLISEFSRLNDHQILFLGAKDVFGDLSLKLLDTTSKTVSNFKIDGKKLDEPCYVSKDKKDIFVSLEPKGSKSGMYRYHLADKSKEFLFGGKELRKALGWKGEYEIVTLQLIYQ